MLIKQLEISEKMNSQSTVNYATGIMNEFFSFNRIRWALAIESP